MIGNRGRGALLLVLVFLAGFAVGLAGERYAVHSPSSAARPDPTGREGRTTIERFADELGVTTGQRARIDPILVETRERMTAIYDRFRPEWEATVDSARTRIEAVLTPQQVERYRELLEQRERQHEARKKLKE